ncbi:MAG: hypothetical protein H0W33_03855 [Gammaproteobacteria bacterium]|nr:hypothetical protein [Gammaproteobacteria bacterium]
MARVNEDLAFIRAVVEGSRRAASVDAMPLIVWGLLTVAGIALVYTVPWLDSVYFWLAVIGLAWAYTLVRAVRRRRSDTVAWFAGHALAVLWLATLAGMTLAGFVGYFSGSLPAAAITPVIAAFFGMGVTASGALLGGRWIAWVGGLWWLSAAIIFYAPAPARLAIFGGAVLLLLVVPALVIHRRWPADV